MRQEFRSSGVQECWSSGVLEFRSVGVLECWSVGVLESENGCEIKAYSKDSFSKWFSSHEYGQICNS
jgi:hypothetical protein